MKGYLSRGVVVICALVDAHGHSLIPLCHLSSFVCFPLTCPSASPFGPAPDTTFRPSYSKKKLISLEKSLSLLSDGRILFPGQVATINP